MHGRFYTPFGAHNINEQGSRGYSGHRRMKGETSWACRQCLVSTGSDQESVMADQRTNGTLNWPIIIKLSTCHLGRNFHTRRRAELGVIFQKSDNKTWTARVVGLVCILNLPRTMIPCIPWWLYRYHYANDEENRIFCYNTSLSWSAPKPEMCYGQTE